MHCEEGRQVINVVLTSSHAKEGNATATQLHAQENLVYERHHQNGKVKEVVVVLPVLHGLSIHLSDSSQLEL